MRFTARLSSARSVDGHRHRLARTGPSRRGPGRAPASTGRGTPPWLCPVRYRYTIAAGGLGAAAARPVTGTIGTTFPTVAVSQLRVDPSVVSPNGDGVGDTARILYFLSCVCPDHRLRSRTRRASARRRCSAASSARARSRLPGSRSVSADGQYSVTITAGSPDWQACHGQDDFLHRSDARTAKALRTGVVPERRWALRLDSVSFQLNAAAAVRVELWRAQKLVGTLLAQTLGRRARAGHLGRNRRRQARRGRELRPHAQGEGLGDDRDAEVARRGRHDGAALTAVSRARMQFWTNEPATLTVDLGHSARDKAREGRLLQRAFHARREALLGDRDRRGRQQDAGATRLVFARHHES